MEKINLVNPEKRDCCGCALCTKMCPVSAIKMVPDEHGYVYPSIDEDKCIHCNKCRNDCVFNGGHNYHEPLKTYAAVRKDKEKLEYSSSGGTFAAVAEKVLKGGGIVCGAVIENDFSIKHVLVATVSDLKPLLGSKYVQSNIESVFEPIRDFLAKGKSVLFCGTPCQVDAIKKYTGNPEKLVTMEVICHGTPNQEMFKAYIKEASGKKKAVGFVFRDKSQGWSFNHRLFFSDGTNKKINHRLSSYMTFFMAGSIYRESCYSCPYAQKKRNADITIGDYWGVVRRNPNIANRIDIDKGVSCVIVNSKKGAEALQDSDMILIESVYEDILDGNGPLNSPSKLSKRRKEVLNIWKEEHTWKRMEEYYKKNNYKSYYKAWSLLPNWARQGVRMLLKKR